MDLASSKRRPARVLLWTSIGALVLSLLLAIFNTSVSLSYSYNTWFSSLFQSTGAHPWWNAFARMTYAAIPEFLYLGVIGLMLWMIWRDEEAEWTSKVSSFLFLAGALIVGGNLIFYFLTGLLNANLGDAVLLKLEFLKMIRTHFVSFGMALWLHALAATQIPKLLEKAVARRAENLLAAWVLFIVGFVLSFGPIIVDATSQPERQTALQLGLWSAHSIGLPLMLVSYSLFSMVLLAGKEIQARGGSPAAPPLGIES